jgi:cytochrome c oxidase subunit 2
MMTACLAEFILPTLLRSAALLADGHMQSALDPAGVQAHSISKLWWGFFWVTAVVYVLVIVFMFAAISRRRRGRSDPSEPPIVSPDRMSERRMTFTVGSATGLTVVIMFVLLICDFVTGRSIHGASDPNPVEITITGHQWWWEVEYERASPSANVRTANEIHIPVGRTVRFELASHDVIHSFWAPNFHGKKDLIPGHPTDLWLKAERAGTFRGQCAEFCGHQHAHMRFVIVAEPERDFQNWLNAQAKEAAAPLTPSQMRGQQVFNSNTCMMCHTISGPGARATVGPDLTHIASRPMIGAATLVNTRDQLSQWIVDPQHIKPGVIMPQNQLSNDDLNALLDYLENLK